jgi:hypothetical protein
VVVGNLHDGSITVFRNTQDWSPETDGLAYAFTVPLRPVVGGACGSVELFRVEVVDIDLDGQLDIIGAVQDAKIWGSSAWILWNQGNGQFDTNHLKILAPAQTGPVWAVTVYNLDALANLPEVMLSGRRRALTSDPGLPVVAVYRQTSPRQFVSTPQWLEPPNSVSSAVATDVLPVRLRGGDMPLEARDLVAPLGTHAATFRILNNLWQQGGILDPKSLDSALPFAVVSLAGGKFRSGALRDVVFINTLDRVAYLYQNVGDGTLTLASTLSASNAAVGEITADVLSDDQWSDVAVACPYFEVGDANGGAAVLVGKGDGTFRANPVRFGINEPNGHPLVVKTRDLNRDFKNDMVVSLHAADKIAVFLGQDTNLLGDPCGGPMDSLKTGE